MTYDVRVYKTEVYRGARGNTYRVRWKVGGELRRKVFPKSAQAETYRSELLTAARRGEAFDLQTAEPASWTRAQRAEVAWFDFACQYVDMKWKAASAKYRQAIAEALVAATPPMFLGRPPASDREVRSTMTHWAFNTRRRDQAPDAAAVLLRWLSANTRPLADLASPTLARDVLEATTSRLDGKRAAPETARKRRMLLVNAMDYAVEVGLVESNPIREIKFRVGTSRTMQEVDRRSVVNHQQARDLLAAVRAQSPSGPRLVAFFALLYYSALRPEEAVALTHANVVLPTVGHPQAWGELHLTSAAPYAGRRWTDDGAIHDLRALKHRLPGESRTVPVPPPLVTILREHLDRFPPRPNGRLFYGVRAEYLAPQTYRRVWQKARRSALSPRAQASPLARRPYDLRHAAVSTWLNAGVPAPQVAEWAGHGVDVLLRIYAKCIEGQQAAAKRRIASALDEGLEAPIAAAPASGDAPRRFIAP